MHITANIRSRKLKLRKNHWKRAQLCFSRQGKQAFHTLLSSSKDHLYHRWFQVWQSLTETGHVSLRQVTGVNRSSSHTHTHTPVPRMCLPWTQFTLQLQQPEAHWDGRQKQTFTFFLPNKEPLNLMKLWETGGKPPPPSATVPLLTRLYHLVEHCGRARGEQRKSAAQEELWSSVSKDGLTSRCARASGWQDLSHSRLRERRG